MKRRTISLPDDLALRLDQEAKRQSTSRAEIVRQALIEYLDRPTPKRVIPFAGIGFSGYRHTARDIEEILAAEWAQDPDP
jgi:metal-responsive CopG/Arc/MetJ family transcriptional regulator